jgi:transposase-like protein
VSAGSRWPPEAILTAVRWDRGHPLSAGSVMVSLAARGIDVSPRTVLRWVKWFGPLLAAEVRQHRRRPGGTWWVDEVFLFRKKAEEKRYLSRAIDAHGQVLDILFREHRDTESAEACFRQTRRRTGVVPTSIVTDHHRPYIRAVQAVFPEATHLRTGLHRATGETTKPIERSHLATRDRLAARLAWAQDAAPGPARLRGARSAAGPRSGARPA